MTQASTVQTLHKCSKCGGSGECRPGFQHCRDCERKYGRERYQKQKARWAKYREENREHYRALNLVISRRRKAERQQEIDRLKSVPCKDCGMSYPPYVMDFDHLDPSTKLWNINHLIHKTAAPWSRLLTEINKCDVVCVRCHRLRTWHPPKQSSTRTRLVQSLKAVPCIDCGDTFHYSQMDFDHVRGKKLCCVPHAGSKAAIRTEAAKCDVVCANCHRERTQRKLINPRRNNTGLELRWQRKTTGPQTLFAPAPPVPERHRSWHALVGTMSDVAVAKEGGVTPAAVCVYRKKIGVPVFCLDIAQRYPWHPLAGTVSDGVLASQWGLTRKTVGRHRQLYGLPVYRRK